MRDERRNLPADEKNSHENRDDPRPLPSRHVFLKKMAARPTVTAPYSELRTVITATCSIFIPRLLRTNALVSKTPMLRAIQRTSPRGRRTGCLEMRIVAAVSAALVKRIIHTV